MKKVFILALIQVMAPFTALGMIPSFQGQNNEIPVITSYLENTDPRIQPNQYIGNPIYATVAPGVMPTLNNNQTSNPYWTNNANQQTNQNQAHYNPIQYLFTVAPIDIQKQKNVALEIANTNQGQSKKRIASYPQQNKRQKVDPKINKFKNLKSTDLNPSSLKLLLEQIYKNTFENNNLFEIKDEVLQELISDNDIEQTEQNIEQLSWAIDCPINNCQHTSYVFIKNKYLYANLKNHIDAIHADNPNVQKTVDKIDQLKINLVLNRKKYQPIRLVKRLEAHDNNITSIKIHLEQRYKSKFKNRQLCEINNELLQKIISDNGIEQTKQNINELSWTIDCPVADCQHTTYISINNKYLCTNLKKHINAIHAGDPDLQKIINKIDQQKINLVFNEKKHQPIIQDLEAHDNNITSIKTHLEQRYQNIFKNNNRLPEIKDEFLEKIISHSGIEQTKQNIEGLYWTIDCPIDNCQHIAHTSINNKCLYGNLKNHINAIHADNPDIQKIADEVHQLKINLVLNRKKYQPIRLVKRLEAHGNTNMPPLENNQQTECIDQEFAYDNDPQLVVPNFYFDDFDTIELESFFDDQNQTFDLFNTNQ